MTELRPEPGALVAVMGRVFQREHGPLAVAVRIGAAHEDIQDVEIAPWLSADDLAALGRLAAAVYTAVEAYPEACEEGGTVMQALRLAYEDTLSVRERLHGKAEGWA
jgi:hypothetical protein